MGDRWIWSFRGRMGDNFLLVVEIRKITLTRDLIQSLTGINEVGL